jgi:hypothetical protein
MSYEGCVVEESLEDIMQVNDYDVISVRVTEEEEEPKNWHVYKIRADEAMIGRIAANLKDKWYAHFWEGRKMLVVFKRKKFEVNLDDDETKKPVVEYGVSVGIPEKFMDMGIE